MTLQTLLVFAAMEFVFSITPGPAVLLVSAYGFRRGWPAAMAAVLGIETGNTIYLAISAMGLGALLVASSLAFAVVKWTGAAYLVCLGAWTIWKAGRQSATQEPRLGTFSHPFVQALLTQLGNPKAVLFFGALIPQFLDARAVAAAICGNVGDHRRRRNDHRRRLWLAGRPGQTRRESCFRDLARTRLRRVPHLHRRDLRDGQARDLSVAPLRSLQLTEED